uniref:Uncharacterized protein n=1 Tax=Glossina palpalis gambiensis TaxID=67801 RepID=A0A1B0BF73_9MUSC
MLLFCLIVPIGNTYVSGALRFGNIDVTEAQLTISIHLMSTVFVREFWLTKLIFLAVPFTKVMNNEGCGKSESTVADDSVFSPSILLTLMILPAFIIVKEYLCGAKLFCFIAFDFVIAKMEYLGWSHFSLGLFFLNQYFNCVVCKSHSHIYRTLPATHCGQSRH